MGFMVHKVALDQGFLRVLRFPLPIIIPPMLHSDPTPEVSYRIGQLAVTTPTLAGVRYGLELNSLPSLA